MRKRKKKKDEPIYMKMYREQILKPKQKERFKEQAGRTEASRSGFYNSPGWKKVRLLRITNNPLCQHCEKRGFVNRATVVDHVKPVDLFPDLALEYDNTQSLCDFCHDLKTKADTREKKRAEKLERGRALMRDLETGPDPQGGS